MRVLNLMLMFWEAVSVWLWIIPKRLKLMFGWWKNMDLEIVGINFLLWLNRVSSHLWNLWGLYVIIVMEVRFCWKEFRFCRRYLIESCFGMIWRVNKFVLLMEFLIWMELLWFVLKVLYHLPSLLIIVARRRIVQARAREGISYWLWAFWVFAMYKLMSVETWMEPSYDICS